MPATVTLTVTRGELQGREFVFARPMTCLIGRAIDCTLRMFDEREATKVVLRP